MKTLETSKEISAAFSSYEPNGEGAHCTGRLLPNQSDQEWCERGTLNGAPVAVYYEFTDEESSTEDAGDYPWDEEHVQKVLVAEKDEDGNYDAV